MNYRFINIDLETMGGTPAFMGIQIPIKTLFDYLEGGDDLRAPLKTTQTRLANLITPEFTAVNEDVVKFV